MARLLALGLHNQLGCATYPLGAGPLVAPIRKSALRRSAAASPSALNEIFWRATVALKISFVKSGTNSENAVTGKLTLLDGTTVIKTSTAFSGGNSFNPLDDGKYR